MLPWKTKLMLKFTTALLTWEMPFTMVYTTTPIIYAKYRIP